MVKREVMVIQQNYHQTIGVDGHQAHLLRPRQRPHSKSRGYGQIQLFAGFCDGAVEFPNWGSQPRGIDFLKSVALEKGACPLLVMGANEQANHEEYLQELVEGPTKYISKSGKIR